MTPGTRRNSIWFGGTGGFLAGVAWLIWLVLGLGNAEAGHYAQQFNGAPPWPGGVVYYSFDPSVVTNGLQKPYLEAIREWELAGKVRFVPRTNEGHYLILSYNGSAPGTSLTLGNVPVLTANTLARWQLCHQLGHSLGLAHENYRSDRDTYITILTNNLQRGVLPALAEILAGGVTNGPYDFESVMHPSSDEGSVAPGRLDALRANHPYESFQPKMGGKAALSVGDRAAIAGLYGALTNLSPVVTTTADGGPGSLRAALYYANDHLGTRITFNIAASDAGYTNGTFWIRPSGQLPILTADGTEIDGTSQPGYIGQPVIALDGSAVVPEVGIVPGLEVFAGNCLIRGLNIGQFNGGGLGFIFAGATNNRVEGCYVGIGPQGTNSAPNAGVGISMVQGASYNTIGGTNAAQRNIITGNSDAGIVIRGTNSNGNRIIGNFLGLDPTGTQALPNSQTAVQIITGASSNIVGGPSPEFRNYISGNAGTGILIADLANGNVVQGNYIGLDVSGTNVVFNNGSGVGLSDGAVGNLIGGSAPGAGNIVVGNQSYGLAAASAGTYSNLFQGNWVGVDATGKTAAGNGTGIVLFLGAHDNWIGGTDDGAGNVVSGNFQAGIALDGTNTVNNFVAGNRVGTDPSGLIAVPNQADGILVHGSASSNVIGGLILSARNIVSGNNGSGISIEDAFTIGNFVQGNWVGLGAQGTNKLGNGGAGVALLGGVTGNTIGGIEAGAANIVSANQSYGIAVAGNDTAANTIQGNWVGLDVTGQAAAGNGNGIAVFLGSHDNLLGGLTKGAGNVISGNTGTGLFFDGTNTLRNTLQGNKIGTDPAGTTALGNHGEGVYIRNGAGSTMIGGTAPGAGNLISGNSGSGIVISGALSASNVIQGNIIGTDLSGTKALKNAVVGVWLNSGTHDNVVGKDRFDNGAGNTIAYSQAGVVVDGDASTGNTIRANALPHDGGASIFLTSDSVQGSPPYPNDAMDPDAGPNHLQNYPVLSSVDITNGLASVAGQFNSTPNRAFYLDLYRNISTNGATYGDAEAYVGSLQVMTDIDGNAAPFVFKVNAATDFDRFTATATDAVTGDTSELSPVAVRLLVPVLSGPYSYSTTNGMHLSFNLNTGQSYRIQSTTNLVAPTWIDVQTVNADATGPRSFDVKGTNAFQEFFRLVSP